VLSDVLAVSEQWMQHWMQRRQRRGGSPQAVEPYASTGRHQRLEGGVPPARLPLVFHLL
jgi:hypothetical protein